jgi:hypothetical protein
MILSGTQQNRALFDFHEALGAARMALVNR